VLAEEAEPDATNWLTRVLDTPEGVWLSLLLAALWGAGHALTPGHGKTLVAAYLVGERGTVWHAILLGLVTTVTHTGAVLVLALLFRVLPGVVRPIMGLLPLLSGFLIAGLGAWLFFCRISGRADHVHLGGHHHHHSHGHGHGHGHGLADHYHDEHGHVHHLPGNVGWGRLVVLGVSGGIVPCTAAIILFLSALGAQQPQLALSLLLAFSAGLAGVLVAIGMAVVLVKGFAETRWSGGRLLRVLPMASAVIVFCLGLWLCYDSLVPKG
jgi:ABC-type nickel/cobalt efflux system permease component RcnA